MADVPEHLLDDRIIDLAQVIGRLTGLCQPSLEVPGDVLQILHPERICRHKVIGEILRLSGGIHRHDLLWPVGVPPIARVTLDQRSEGTRLLLDRITTIPPLDRMDVVGAKEGWHQPHPTLRVTRLSDIIEARIVHDRRRCAVLLGKGGIPQLLHGVGRGGTHIVLQSESMPYLVRRHIPHGLTHEVIRQLIRPHPRIHGAGLHQTPVVEE